MILLVFQSKTKTRRYYVGQSLSKTYNAVQLWVCVTDTNRHRRIRSTIQVWRLKGHSRCFYRPHPKDDGRLYFHFVCQSTPGGGGTYLPGGGGGYLPSQVWVGGTYLGRGGHLPWLGWGGTYLGWGGGVPTFPGLGGGVPTFPGLDGGYLAR